MNPLVVTYATHENDKGLHSLIKSLKQYRWDFEILGLGDTWQGFGSKIVAVRDNISKWQHEGYTHIIFVDAYDVVANRYKDDTIYSWDSNSPIIFSGELNCWPDAERAKDYVGEAKYRWQYVNSGSYMLNITPTNIRIHDIFEGIEKWHDDQRHMTSVLLDKGLGRVDNKCEIFQSIAFCHPWQEWFEVRPDIGLYNKVTNTCPYFIHGNGRTDMSWVPFA